MRPYLLSIVLLLGTLSLAAAASLEITSSYTPGPTSGAQPEGFVILLKGADGQYSEAARVPVGTPYVTPELPPGTYCYQARPYHGTVLGSVSNEECRTLVPDIVLDGGTTISISVRQAGTPSLAPARGVAPARKR